jgi:hypothetical protein
VGAMQDVGKPPVRIKSIRIKQRTGLKINDGEQNRTQSLFGPEVLTVKSPGRSGSAGKANSRDAFEGKNEQQRIYFCSREEEIWV